MSIDNFESSHFVDPKTGKIHRKYLYKRKLCNRLVLTSKIAAQLSGYTLIEKDLRNCLIWLKEIERRHVDYPAATHVKYHASKDRENYDLIKGLFVAVLTFYGKCFSSCEGRRVKLERTKLDQSFHEMHDRCISYRNNFAAHSGAEKLEEANIVLAYIKIRNGKMPVKLYREVNQPDIFWTRDDSITLISLVEHVQEIVQAKMGQLSTKIQLEEGTADAISRASKPKG